MSFINTKKLQKQQVRNATKVTPPRPAVCTTGDINTMPLEELRNAYRQLQQTLQQQQAAASNFATNTDALNFKRAVTGNNILPLPLQSGQTSALVYFNADMVCEFANEEFNAWLPPGIKQPVGQHHSQFLSEAVFAEVLPYIQLALQGKQCQFERKGLIEQTHYGWVRVQYIPVLSNGAVIGYYSILTNITAVKKMTAELAFEHANTLALINNTTDYIWSFGHDLKLISANTPYKLFTEKMCGTKFTQGMDVMPPGECMPLCTSGLLDNCRRALAGETFIAENHFFIEHLDIPLLLETSFCPIIENGKVVAAAAFSRDITARKKEMERLKLLESAITHTKDIVMITKAEPFGEPGPIIEYVNPAFTAITGYTAEEAIGKSPRFLQGPGSDRQQLSKLRASMEQWQACEVTTLNYKKSGEPYWVNFSVHPVANETGWFTHWVSVERDVTPQKNTELALVSSLKHLENYTQSIEKGTNMVIFDLNGKITFANDRFCHLSKYTREELVGSHMMLLASDQITPEYGQHFWQTVMAGNVFRDQMKKTAKDGSLFWVDATLTPFINTEGEVYQVLAIDTDITQTKLAEEALQLSNDRFNLASKATLDIIWDWDIAKREIYYSDASETLLGYRAGLHGFDLQPQYFNNTHPDDIASVIQSMQFAFNNGSTHWQCKYRLKNRSTNYTTIIDRGIIIRDAQGVPVRMVGAMQDVTAQTASEKALLETNRLLTDYKQALDEANLVFIADADGIIKYANKKLCQTSAYTKAELVGSHVSILKSGYHSDDFTSHLWQTIRAGKIFKAQIKNRAKNGNYYWVDTTITPFLNSDGEFYQFLTIETDITQAKLAQEALEASHNRFNLAVKATMDVIWDWDIAKKEIYLSEASETLLGSRSGIHPFDLQPEYYTKTHPKDVATVIKSMQTALNSGSVHWQQQYRLTPPDGEETTIVDRAVIIRDEQGVAVRMVGAMQNVTAQTLSEKALIETNRLLTDYKQALDEANMVFIADADGIIKYANNNLRQMSGYTKAELIGSHISIFKSSQYSDAFYNHIWQTIQLGKIFKSQIKNRAKNGNYYWVDTTITPFLNSHGKVYQFLSIETDITQTKLAEEALETSNQRFNLAMEATTDVIWDWDILQNHLFLSEAFTANFGLPAGMHHFALTPDRFKVFHPADAPAVLASLLNAVDGPDVFWQHQYRLLKSNGDYATISDRAVILRDENGHALRMVGAKRDITAQVEAAEKERAQELRFREMVYNVNDVITIIDEKGFVLYSSPSLKAVAGFEPDEVVGLKSFTLAHPEDYATLKQNHAALLQNPGNGQVVEVRYRHKNGHYINIEIQGNNQLHNPAIRGIILTTRDVTARNQKETERRELLYELMRKNTDLRQFSYLAGHHLRAPLTNLSAICTLLDADGLAPDEVPMLLNAFKTSTLKINEVLDDIIKILLVKDSAPKQVKETVHLQQALAVATHLNKHAIASSSAKITANFSSAPQVEFSKAYMEDIFAELITNAIQFAHNQRPPVINITATTTGSTVVLTIADNGLGIDMDKAKNKVFGLYQRFTNVGTGRGLGLYMAQAKLAMYGYTIAVQSTVNKGSTFTIRLHNQPVKN